MIHAESNCLSLCKKGEVRLLAVTLLPCSSCATMIAAYGVEKVVYCDVYEKDDKAVNIDKIELNCKYADIESLKEKEPENMQIVAMESDILTEIKQARIGAEIWRYILYLAIILLMIEMLLSNAKRQN